MHEEIIRFSELIFCAAGSDEPAAVSYGYAAISGTGPVLIGTIHLISVSMGRNVIKMRILCHIFFGRMIIFVMQKCSNIIKT